jgi:hypothetical protein
MTDFLEEQLTAGMREGVAGITIATDVVGEMLRIQRRRTMIAWTATAAWCCLRSVWQPAISHTVEQGMVKRSADGNATAGPDQPPRAAVGPAPARTLAPSPSCL